VALRSDGNIVQREKLPLQQLQPMLQLSATLPTNPPSAPPNPPAPLITAAHPHPFPPPTKIPPAHLPIPPPNQAKPPSFHLLKSTISIKTYL
jgi:hypothetical protein